MGLRLAEKGFRASAGSWWGKVVDDDGNTVAESWQNSAEEIDAWFVEVLRKSTEGPAAPSESAAVNVESSTEPPEGTPVRLDSEDDTPLPRMGSTHGKRKK